MRRKEGREGRKEGRWKIAKETRRRWRRKRRNKANEIRKGKEMNKCKKRNGRE